MSGFAQRVSLGIRADSLKALRLRLLLLAGAVLLSRLPFVRADFGLDPDSYRVAAVARHLAETGEYAPSRLPGYPVHEFLTAWVLPLGPEAANLLTVVFSVAAALTFVLILRRLGIAAPELGGLALAFVPVIFGASTVTIDYVWALAFILMSFHELISRRTMAAGILLGLATGCRLTSFAMMAAFAVYLTIADRTPRSIPSPRKAREIAVVCLSAVVVAAGCYAPVVARHGLRFIGFYRSGYPPLANVAARFTEGVWGTLGCLALMGLLISIALDRTRLRAAFSERSARAAMLASGVTILVFVAAFACLPEESGYLVPMIPFVLLLLALWVPWRRMRFLYWMLIASPFMFSVDHHGIHLAGAAFQDHRTRGVRRETTDGILRTVGGLTERSVIVAGPWYPRIEYALRGSAQGPHRYVSFMHSVAELESYVGRGFALRYLPGECEYNLRLSGIELRSHGATELPPLGGFEDS